MNFFGISGLINAITSLLVGIFVYTRNPRNNRNITFSLTCLSIFLWSGLYFLWQTTYDSTSALLLARLLMAPCVFISVFYLHFLLIFVNQDKKKLLIFLYIYATILLISSFTPYLVKGVSRKLIFPFWPSPGVFYHLYLLMFTYTVFYIFYLIYSAYKKSSGIKRTQLKYLLIASIAGWVGGASNHLLWYNVPILPYGNILVSGYMVLAAYAILRHQLMDITVAIRKTAIYSIVATVITLVYFILIYIMEGLFRGFIGYKSIPWTLSVIIVFTLIFQPLKNLVQVFVDKHLFKDSQLLLQEELKRTQEELKRSERLKAVGTLAAGMAHEIKNPLTGIKTFLEYLPSKHNDSDFIQKFHRIGGQEIVKINNIVQQLLDFSKPKALKLEKCDINTLLDETLGFLNNEFINHGINIVKNYEPSSLLTFADCNQLKQVFLNLFLNAIDAMKQGGTLTITTKLLADTLEITIADTGTGISTKDLEHIFDPFYTTKEAGTGLGMSIVYGIIKEHKGEITVESEVGKGTAFKMRFVISV